MDRKIIQISPYNFKTSLEVESTKISNRLVILVPKIDYSNMMYKIDLNKEEIKWLSDKFQTDATPKYNPEKPHPIWGTNIAKVKLRFQRMMLNLDEPVQYVKYKVIKSYPEIIAPSLSAIQDGKNSLYANAIFYFENDIEEIKKRASSLKRRNEAIAFITTTGMATLRNIAIAMGIAKDYNTPSNDEITLALSELAEKDPETILKYKAMKATEIDALALVRIGLREGFLKKVGDVIYMDESELAHQRDIVKFLLDKKNKAYLETLRQRVAEVV